MSTTSFGGVREAGSRRAAACEPGVRVTRSLLGYGVVAGPFYVALVLGQALLRPGFDLVHDDASLLSNGPFGWVQVANFVLTGLMVIACAAGIRRALRPGMGSLWAPVLLAVFGLGLVGAGVFVADPMGGFPPGTPAGRPESISVHGLLHIASAGIGFLGFAAACVVVGQRFARDRRARWAWFSRVTAVVFLAGFAGVASGSGTATVVIGFWIALLVAWAWLGGMAVTLYREMA